MALLVLALLCMSCAGAPEFDCSTTTGFRLLNGGETAPNLLKVTCSGSTYPQLLNYSFLSANSSAALTFAVYNTTDRPSTTPVLNITMRANVGGSTGQCGSYSLPVLQKPPVGTVYSLSLICTGSNSSVCRAYFGALSLTCVNASTAADPTTSSGSGADNGAAAVTPQRASVWSIVLLLLAAVMWTL